MGQINVYDFLTSQSIVWHLCGRNLISTLEADMMAQMFGGLGPITISLPGWNPSTLALIRAKGPQSITEGRRIAHWVLIIVLTNH